VIIIDNASEDGTPDFVETEFPSVKVIRNCNTGYGAGNNLGVTYATGDFVVILNPDTVVKENWLRELVVPLQGTGGRITTPKILLYDGSAINTCGNLNHFTGLTFTRGLLDPPQSHTHPRRVSGVSGACFAIRREDYLKINGFDERFFVYNEDSEFSWRAHSYNFAIDYVPTSILCHDYSLSVSPKKLHYLEKGRYMILRSYLSGGMAITLFPSLMIAEILTFGYALKSGLPGLQAKISAIREGAFGPDNSRHFSGTVVLEQLEVQIPIDQLVSSGMERIFIGICNAIFSCNFKIMKAISLHKIFS
jgi:GT2 family glycosyltransferase